MKNIKQYEDYINENNSSSMNDEENLSDNIVGWQSAFMLITDSKLNKKTIEKIEKEYQIVIEKTLKDRYCIYAKDADNEKGFKKFKKDFFE